MSDTDFAPQSGGDTSPHIPTTEITAPRDAPEAVSSVSAAAKMLRSARKQSDTQEAHASGMTERAPEATPEPSSSPADDAAPLETEAPGATETDDPAPQEPSIEPPRSWTAEAKDAFRALPRAQQEWIKESEKTREAEFRRGQNEVTEKQKAIEAERQKLEQTRSQYEAALPTLLQSLHQNPEFADIRTMADVERMANEDWPRFAKWQFHQQKVAAVEAELKASQERQESEHRTQWEHFAKRQDELFLERAPEMQDATKRAKTVEAATKLLGDKGYTQEELGRLWNNPVFRDARMQQLILDAVRFQEAKKGALEATKKTLPPVVRPGVAQPGKDRDLQIKSLETQIDKSSGINALRAAAKLVATNRSGKR
jgi:hypothetical protein